MGPASREPNPRRVRLASLIVASSLYMFPIVALLLVSTMNIPIGFNTGDADLFMKVAAGILALFWIVASAILPLGIRKQRPVREKHVKTRPVKVIQGIAIAATASTAVVLAYLFNAVTGLACIPLGLWVAYLQLHVRRPRVTTRGRRFVATMALMLLAGNVTFLGAVTTFSVQYTAMLERYRSMAIVANPVFDAYGGLDNFPAAWGEFNATGYFSIQKQHGRYWFVTPLGNPYISKGVNHVSPRNDVYLATIMEKHGSREAWAVATLDLLQRHGFNTVTSWSAPEVMNYTIPYTVLLDLGWRFRTDEFPLAADYFDPRFEVLVDTVVEQLVVPRQNDTLLVGFFTDNELHWGPDWRTHLTLLQMYMGFASTAPGQVVAIEFLRDQAGTVDAFNAAWGTSIESLDAIGTLPVAALAPSTPDARRISEAFDGIVAERYGNVTATKIRAAAPNHLILGCRFAGNPGELVMENTARHTDVFSYAGYNFDFSWEQWDRFVEKMDRPVLVEEFSYRAMDVGLPNIFYSGPVVLNQHQRSIEFARYVEILMSKPYGVGYHWFEFCDNPRYSFLHGENYGIVNVNDEPYQVFLDMAAALNAVLDHVHGSPA